MNQVATAHLSPREQHAAEPYPHRGCCPRCVDFKLCTCCGTDLRGDRGRCTNGHCSSCHRDCCTSGGATEPGHGYGTEADRRVTYGRRLSERPRTNAKPYDERRDYYCGTGWTEL